jgi:hypothetical protein
MIKNLSMVLGCILSLKPTAYISLFYRFIAIIFIPLDLFLYAVENLYFNKIRKKLKEPKLIFIIGSHRTGTTFFAQSLCLNSKFDNLSNFQLIFKRSTFFSNLLKINIKNIFFKNFYGQSFRLSDIGDLNEFWNYHLKLNDNEYIPGNIRIDSSIKYFIKRYYSYNKKPIIIKSGRNLFIIKKLSKLFSNSFFVIIDRDNTKIIKSLSKAKSIFFNYDWGLKIKDDKKFYDYSLLKKNLLIKKMISEQIKTIDKNRYLKINFEDFLKNDKKIIKKTKKKINEFFYQT